MAQLVLAYKSVLIGVFNDAGMAQDALKVAGDTLFGEAVPEPEWDEETPVLHEPDVGLVLSYCYTQAEFDSVMDEGGWTAGEWNVPDYSKLERVNG